MKPKMLVDWTHADLVALAARWLRRQHAIVATDLVTGNFETPDAIGWHGSGHSTVIEAKVSRADYLRDAQKPFRRNPFAGMGNYRWYLAPPGLLSPDELPANWGLLEPSLAGLMRRKEAVAQEASQRAESAALVSCLRRIGVSTIYHVVSVKAYHIDTGATKTTLGIRSLEVA